MGPEGEVTGSSCWLIAAHQTGFAGTDDQETVGVLWGLACHVPTCLIWVSECDSQVSVPCVSELCFGLCMGKLGLRCATSQTVANFVSFFFFRGGVGDGG